MMRNAIHQRCIRKRCAIPRCADAILRGAIALAALACGLALRGQAQASAYQVEAVYLFNFSRFVEWPAQVTAVKNEPFGICVLGTDPFGPALDATLSGEKNHGATLVARRISKAQESSGCRILFVSSSEESRLKEIFSALDGTNVLTVSDIRDFSQRGGMIQFVLAEGKVRFEVNVKNASNAGLTLSSDLLEVALAVRRES
jgi:hypothetical protein